MSATPKITVSATNNSESMVRKVESRQRGREATAASAETIPIRIVMPLSS